MTYKEYKRAKKKLDKVFNKMKKFSYYLCGRCYGKTPRLLVEYIHLYNKVVFYELYNEIISIREFYPCIYKIK